MRNFNLILTFLFLISLSNPAQAQNNIYKIDDDCYRLYDQSIKCRVEKERLVLTEQLRSLALQKKDYKAFVLGLVSNMGYYTQTKDPKACHQWAQQTREAAVKYGYLQYMFHAYSQEAVCLMNCGLVSEAFKLTNEHLKQALKYQDNYGLSSAYGNLGNQHLRIKNFQRAMENYQKAITYSDKADQPTGSYYRNIGQCYYEMGNYALAEQYNLKSLENFRTGNTGAVYSNLCDVYLQEYLDNPTPELAKKYEQAYANFQDRVQNGYAQKNTIDAQEANHALYQGDLKKAKSYLPVLLTNDSITMALRIAKAENDFKSYTQAQARRIQVMRGLQAQQYNVTVAGLQSQFQADLLERERNELDLKNQNLLLREKQNQADLAQARLNNENLRLKEEQNKAELSQARLNNENLKLAQQEQLQESALKEAKLRQEQQDQYVTYLHYVGGFLVFIVVGLIIAVITRINSLRKIRKAKLAADQAREEAEKAWMEAQRANEMKTLFVQNMSHEIRTPLNAICGFSQILSNPEMASYLSEEEKEEYGHVINVNTDLLTTLVNDILDAGELESGNYKLHIAPVDIEHVCQDAVAAVQLRIPEGVEMMYDNQLPTGYSLSTDSQRVRQIIINFLTNSCKHTEQGTIVLCSEKLENGVRFSVTDTGEGIKPEHAESIFHRFEKENSFKQGSGLGLHICRQLSEVLGGRVYLDTTYTAGGARFIFDLPQATQKD